MMLFPGISQIQSALIGMAFGIIVGGAGVGVVEYKMLNSRYETLVANQALAHSAAVADELVAQAKFQHDVSAANDKAAALQRELDSSRLQKQTVLHDVIVKEGKKDATLAACLSRQLPADVLSNLAH